MNNSFDKINLGKNFRNFTFVVAKVKFIHENTTFFLSLSTKPQEEIHERPQITSMIGSLANYSNTIPSAPADGDAKPPQPSARMGKFHISR